MIVIIFNFASVPSTGIDEDQRRCFAPYRYKLCLFEASSLFPVFLEDGGSTKSESAGETLFSTTVLLIASLTTSLIDFEFLAAYSSSSLCSLSLRTVCTIFMFHS